MVGAEHTITGRYAHRFLYLGPDGCQFVDFAALDELLNVFAEREVSTVYRALAADYRDRAEHITADAGAGEYSAGLFVELAEELDRCAERTTTHIARRLGRRSTEGLEDA
jgi:hypothetical protein